MVRTSCAEREGDHGSQIGRHETSKWNGSTADGRSVGAGDGHYTVRARSISTENPVLTLRKSELVIKQ